MTVTPAKMGKQFPVEKRAGEYGIVDLQTDSSRLAPKWMQQQTSHSFKGGAPRLVKMCPVKEKPSPTARNNLLSSHVLRQESGRLWICDDPQPSGSVFSLGNYRHDQALTERKMK